MRYHVLLEMLAGEDLHQVALMMLSLDACELPRTTLLHHYLKTV
jgi:hypothetical protein